MKELYTQAVLARWLIHSESNFQNFVAAAVRATKTASNDPVRVFVSIVKKQLWGYITQAQEARACEVIKRYNEKTSDQATIYLKDTQAKTALTPRILTIGESSQEILQRLVFSHC